MLHKSLVCEPGIRITKHWRKVVSEWPDGYIIIQYLAIYSNDDLPKNAKFV